MHIRSALAAVAMLVSTSMAAQASTPDENRAAVRQMFPIVSMFDKRKAAGSTQTADTSAVTHLDSVSNTGGPISTGEGAAKIRGFALAGVKLGMSRTQAVAGLTASGYHLTNQPMTLNDTYNTVVGKKRSNINPTYRQAVWDKNAISSDDAASTNGQTVYVGYISTKAGPVVVQVRYEVDKAMMQLPALQQAAVSRYGKPTATIKDYTGERYYWCAQKCSTTIINEDGQETLEVLESGGINRYQILLSDGALTKKARDDQAMAEARNAEGTVTKPSF